MNSKFAMLLRREFWEHRSLWMAPLVWAGILLVLWIWLLFVMAHDQDFARFSNVQTIEQLEGISEEQRQEMVETIRKREKHNDSITAMSFLVISSLISTFMVIVVFFYLIDCLFTERRDRSILFWKSLPVSDAQVVLSKYVVALVLVPIGVIALATVTQLLMSGLVWLKFHGTFVSNFMPDWTMATWFRAVLVDSALMFGGILWYAPIAAYFLLLSVSVRKLVFLWAIVPFFTVPLLEFIFFRSTKVFDFLGQRFGGYVEVLNIKRIVIKNGGGMPSVDSLFDSMQLSAIFTSGEMWLGLAAAAAMAYVTIYIRRHRDET